MNTFAQVNAELQASADSFVSVDENAKRSKIKINMCTTISMKRSLAVRGRRLADHYFDVGGTLTLDRICRTPKINRPANHLRIIFYISIE